jgi:hypothetical protein
MARNKRKEIIAKIEENRGSRVLSYVTGDRAPAIAQIGDDAVRPLYQQLREIDTTDKLDFFIYSRGGAIDVPWRMATALRSTAKQWAALIPFRANSAATLLAMGADQIILGKHGELGPIDPIMNIQRVMPQPGGGGGTVVQEPISVEDVMAYIRFIQERAGLSDQTALSTGLSKLTERLDAVALGNAYRTHSHIRDVARRMLLSRKKPGSEQTMATIIESLAERVYAHGHAIGFTTAKEIGLPAERAGQELDELMWSLLREYETDLKLLQPIDPASAVATSDLFTEDAVIAVIESTTAAHEFIGRIEIKARRQMPQNLNVSFNLNLQVPGGAQQVPPQVQQQIQQVLQQAQQAILQQAQQAVQDALREQAPVVGKDAGFRDGVWKRIP